jgi:hypothetical protein
MYKTKNEEDVLTDILTQKAAGKSLREIATEYGNSITYGDVFRMIHGIFSKGAMKRSALGLPIFLLAPACHYCGYVHIAKRCPEQRTAKRVSRPRHVPAWLDEAIENLRRLEAAANPPTDTYRVYGRGGRRVIAAIKN